MVIGRWWIFFVVFHLAASVYAQEDTEPDNDRQHAQLIAFDQTVTRQLSPKGDYDWFKLQVPTTGIVRFHVEGWDAKAYKADGPYIEYRDADGVRISTWEYETRALEGTLYAAVAESLRADRVTGAGAPFQVKFTFTPETDPSEPNNDMKTARPMTFGQQVDMRLAPWADVDYFRLDVPATGTVTLHLDGWQSEKFKGNYPYVRFFDAKGNRTREYKHDVQATAGPLYVAIVEAGKTKRLSSEADSLKVSFSFEPETDPSEPNNDMKTARPMKFGEQVEARLVPWYDTDFYRLDVPETGTVRLNLEGWNAEAFKKEFPYIRFFDAKGNRLREWRADVQAQAGPLYAAIVEEWQSSKIVGAADPFKVSFTFEPETDPSEPNNDMKTARPMKFGEEVEARLVPWYDTDFFRLEVPATGTVRLKIDGWNAEAFKKDYPYVRYFDKEGNKLREWRHDVQAQAGPLYAAIAEEWQSSKIVGAADPFKVSFSFEPETDPSEPNDSLQTARLVKLGETVTSRLVPWYDTDYYRLEMPATGTLRVAIDGWNAEAFGKKAPYVRFFDANGNKLREWTYEALVAKGTAYVAIVEHWNSRSITGAADPFTVTFTLTESVDPTEPNDTVAQARTLAFDQPAKMQFLPRGDVDYFKIAIEQPSIITWQVQDWDREATGLDGPRVVFVDSENSRISYDRPDVRAKPGMLFGFLTEHWQDSRLKGVEKPFAVTFSCADEPDMTEPANESASGALPVTFGKPFTAIFAPSYDVDYVSFTLDTAGPITLEQTAGPQGVVVGGAIYNAAGKHLFTYGQPGESNSLPPGDYTLALTATKHPGGIAEPVTLKLTARNAKPPPPANLQRWLFNVERTE